MELGRVSRRGEDYASGEAIENIASLEGIARKYPVNADSTNHMAFGHEGDGGWGRKHLSRKANLAVSMAKLSLKFYIPA